ncbi:MAG: hypothetical protein GY772_21590, partial [bacterium]|nr:hypothetical protein [bacterium]
MDFYVTRADSTAVLLHPHKCKKPAEAQIIVGRVRDSLQVHGEQIARPPSFHAGAHGSEEGDIGAVAVNDELCREVPQMDRIGHLVASQKLLEIGHSAGLEFGRRCEVPCFGWWRFLADFRGGGRAGMFQESAVVHFGVGGRPEPQA